MDVTEQRLILVLKSEGETGGYPMYESAKTDEKGKAIVTGVYIQRDYLPDPLPQRLVVSFDLVKIGMA